MALASDEHEINPKTHEDPNRTAGCSHQTMMSNSELPDIRETRCSVREGIMGSMESWEGGWDSVGGTQGTSCSKSPLEDWTGPLVRDRSSCTVDVGRYCSIQLASDET